MSFRGTSGQSDATSAIKLPGWPPLISWPLTQQRPVRQVASPGARASGARNGGLKGNR